MTTEILFEKRGAAGIVTLNRPHALNALNRAMCLALRDQLGRWEMDADVRVVILQAAGEKAFCAGGDVVGLYHAGRAGSADWQDFFADEYRMNLAIGTYGKPLVALIDGVTMGGGVGISIHAPFRVATERTLFAMPETAIGLIPDVGGTHALPRLSGEIGTFLGLTGARLKAADCLYAGIATHHVPAAGLAAVVAALSGGGDVAAVLASAHADPGRPALAGSRASIDHHFAFDSVELIMNALSTGDAWAEAQRDLMMKMSPTSMKLTLRALREGKADDLAGCLRREYRVVCAIRSGHDFYEGVRAQLIDKDRKPRWRPAALRDVDATMVDSHFVVPAWGDLDLQ